MQTISLRRHLRKTEIVAGRVTRVDHAHIVLLASVQHPGDAFSADARPGAVHETLRAGDAGRS